MSAALEITPILSSMVDHENATHLNRGGQSDKASAPSQEAIANGSTWTAEDFENRIYSISRCECAVLSCTLPAGLFKYVTILAVFAFFIFFLVGFGMPDSPYNQYASIVKICAIATAGTFGGAVLFNRLCVNGIKRWGVHIKTLEKELGRSTLTPAQKQELLTLFDLVLIPDSLVENLVSKNRITNELYASYRACRNHLAEAKPVRLIETK